MRFTTWRALPLIIAVIMLAGFNHVDASRASDKVEMQLSADTRAGAPSAQTIKKLFRRGRAGIRWVS